MVGLSGQFVVLVGFTKDQLVVSKTERIPVHGHRVQVDIRVAALGLAGRAAIKVPNRQFYGKKYISFVRNLFPVES